MCLRCKDSKASMYFDLSLILNSADSISYVFVIEWRRF